MKDHELAGDGYHLMKDYDWERPDYSIKPTITLSMDFAEFLTNEMVNEISSTPRAVMLLSRLFHQDLFLRFSGSFPGPEQNLGFYCSGDVPERIKAAVYEILEPTGMSVGEFYRGLKEQGMTVRDSLETRLYQLWALIERS